MPFRFLDLDLEVDPVVDPGIDRQGGAPIFFQDFILTTAGFSSFLYVLEGSGGMLPWKILKSEASNNASWGLFWPESGRFCLVFEALNGGGGERAGYALLWIRH